MKLADLRKVSVKKHLRISFVLSNGLECVMSEHGIARIPALRTIPSFNLEEELGSVQSFVAETVTSDKDKGKAKTQKYTRDEIIALANAGGPDSHAHDDHED